MSEMVERVARELAIAADHANWEEFVMDARMAIAAMREPTKAMVDAADPYYLSVKDTDFKEAWRLMIDAALNAEESK